MTKTLEEIIEAIKKRKKVLKEKYNVKEIGIFGSYVRAEQKRGSDIDILVEFDEVPDLLKFIEIESYLSRALQKKVDLVEKSSLRQRLKNIILNEVVPI